MTLTIARTPIQSYSLLDPALDPASLRALGDRIAVFAEHDDRSAAFPWQALDEVHRAGLLTATVGEQWGGRGVSTVESVELFRELGRGHPSVALITAMTAFTHQSQAVIGYWPTELYERVLAESAERPTLINAVRAEPELGAPARGGLPTTTLRRTAAGWILDGHKAFATGAEGLAYHLVWAVTDEPIPRVGHIIVPAFDNGYLIPGIEIISTWDHLGMRASSTHDVVYRGIEVPFENFSGVPVGEPDGSSRPGAIGLAVSSLYLGVARAAQEFFLRYANERVPSSLGRPIATTERIQSTAGEIEAQLVQAEELLFALAMRFDRAQAAGDSDALLALGDRAVLAKTLVSRAAISAVQTAVAALGNPALTRANPLERALRDVLCSRPHPPQDDAALLIAGRAALKRAEPKS
ncbi:MAG TPA: acyl-CoA dehydrogenase family protein [Pseudolysinimonas sp.]|nr:acyl-CoA dehydrogenase family protein [Pseudolysinimonas sp.]